ncbi:MAG TPA: glucoamylase family protein [Bacteroidales bacterium]|nr:glucoamylase family protein [Bacteroidales bacterium]
MYDSYTFVFHTALDETPKFPVIEDDSLLTLIQRKTFDYFWDYGHPVSGLSRDRLGGGDVVTSGGSGFGMMAILVGIERGFITRQEGFERLNTMVNFLIKPSTNKFHGAFPHWLNGSSGMVYPFSTTDNGGDLVETAFLMQGLLTVKQYFTNGSVQETAMCDSITKIWGGVEWDWYRHDSQNRLYWHWSPDYNWEMNMPVTGWNEALIVYILAASSPSHSITKEVYDEGWARNGAIRNGNTYYNIELPLGESLGGPMFFAHYSFLGLDPRNLDDVYADYWVQNTAHALINHAYCADNPMNYPGYSEDCWGLTASDIPNGYSASSPTNDLGVIAPTAAISSIPYTPDKSMDAIRFFYYILGDQLWGEYGFYDAFSLKDRWFASSFLAIDQGPIVCMIENYRTGLLWELFMQDEDVKAGLTKLGFSY